MSLLQISGPELLSKRQFYSQQWIASLSGQERAHMKRLLLSEWMEAERCGAPTKVYLAIQDGLLALETLTGTSSAANSGLTTSKPASPILTRTVPTASLKTRVRRSLSAMLSPLRLLLTMPVWFTYLLLTGLAYLLSDVTKNQNAYGRLSPPTNLLTSGESWSCSTARQMKQDEVLQARKDLSYALRRETIAGSALQSNTASLRKQILSQ